MCRKRLDPKSDLHSRKAGLGSGTRVARPLSWLVLKPEGRVVRPAAEVPVEVSWGGDCDAKVDCARGRRARRVVARVPGEPGRGGTRDADDQARDEQASQGGQLPPESVEGRAGSPVAGLGEDPEDDQGLR